MMCWLLFLASLVLWLPSCLLSSENIPSSDPPPSLSLSNSTSSWIPTIPMQFVDCSKPTGHMLLTPPFPTNCEKHVPPKKFRRGTVSIFVTNETIEEFQAIKCSIENYLEKKSTYVTYTTRAVEFEKTIPTSAETCQQAWDDKYWNGLPIKFNKKTRLFESDFVEEIINDSGFSAFTPHVSRLYRILLEKGLVSLPEVNSNKVISMMMPIAPACKFENGTCQDGFAVLIWKPEEKRKFCSHLHVGKYNATIGDHTIIIDEMQAAFKVDNVTTPNNISNCFPGVYDDILSSKGSTFFIFNETVPDELYPDEIWPFAPNPPLPCEGNILMRVIGGMWIECNDSGPPNAYNSQARYRFIEINDDETKEQEENNRKEKQNDGTRFKREIRKTDPGMNSVGSKTHTRYMKEVYDGNTKFNEKMTARNMDAKLQYTVENIGQENQENFHTVLENICHVRNQQLLAFQAILKLNPSEGMRLFLNRDDVIAFYTGKDVLQVTSCATVTITHIQAQSSKTSVCLDAVEAMTSDNRTVFIKPGSNFIHPNATKIDCAFRINFIHQDINGEWVGTDNLKHRVMSSQRDNETETTKYVSKNLVFYAGDTFSGVKVSSFPSHLAAAYGADIRSQKLSESNPNNKGGKEQQNEDGFMSNGPEIIKKGKESAKEWSGLEKAIATLTAVAIIALLIFLIWFFHVPIIAGILLLQNIPTWLGTKMQKKADNLRATIKTEQDKINKKKAERQRKRQQDKYAEIPDHVFHIHVPETDNSTDEKCPEEDPYEFLEDY